MVSPKPLVLPPVFRAPNAPTEFFLAKSGLQKTTGFIISRGWLWFVT
jgi:hypothetical protein